MKKEVITVLEGVSILEVIKSLGERTKKCRIFVDEGLINKELLVEDETKGVYYLKEEGYNMGFDSETEEDSYWLLWYLSKPESGEKGYSVSFFEAEIYFYLQKHPAEEEESAEE